MAYTLDGNSLGKIQSEEVMKVADLEIIEGIYEDSDATLISDWASPKKTIKLRGIYTSVDGTLSTFISTINNLVDGTQDAAIVYHSDLTGADTNVFVQSWDYRYVTGSVTYIEYSIDLIEGTAL